MKIEPEDLKPFETLFREVIREELAVSLRTMGQGRQDDTVLDVAGLCDYLKVTPKWVYEQTHLKAIPHYKLTGKALRFKRSEIDKWLASLKSPALSEPTGKVRFLKR